LRLHCKNVFQRSAAATWLSGAVPCLGLRVWSHPSAGWRRFLAVGGNRQVLEYSKSGQRKLTIPKLAQPRPSKETNPKTKKQPKTSPDRNRPPCERV
jgi:hypothetical protein